MAWLVTAVVTVCMEKKILVMRMGDLLPAPVWIMNLSLKSVITFNGVDKTEKYSSDCGFVKYLANNAVLLKPPSTFICWKNMCYKIVTHHSWLDQYSLVKLCYNCFPSQIVEATTVVQSLGLYPAQIVPKVMIVLCVELRANLATGISMSGPNIKFCSTLSSLLLRVIHQVGL